MKPMADSKRRHWAKLVGGLVFAYPAAALLHVLMHFTVDGVWPPPVGDGSLAQWAFGYVRIWQLALVPPSLFFVLSLLVPATMFAAMPKLFTWVFLVGFLVLVIHVAILTYSLLGI